MGNVRWDDFFFGEAGFKGVLPLIVVVGFEDVTEFIDESLDVGFEGEGRGRTGFGVVTSYDAGEKGFRHERKNEAMKGGMRERVELCTKFGVSLVSGNMEVHGDPAYVRAACEASLKRLDTNCIDLYYQHRIDTSVPIEITIGELKKLVEEGKIKYVGLSEASASTIRRAHAAHPITAVQLEWSLWTRDAEEEIIPTCRELGIGIVAYSPLGRGFFSSGAKMAENLTENDARKNLSRFQPDNLKHNKNIFEQVNEMAERKGCTPSQLALAWVHHQGNDVCPIPGTTKIENFNNNIGALSVKLSVEDMAQLESISSANVVKGDRYMSVSKNFSWNYTDTPPLSSWKA
ncbi:unnamed protein product [Camellia sinensis]